MLLKLLMKVLMLVELLIYVVQKMSWKLRFKQFVLVQLLIVCLFLILEELSLVSLQSKRNIDKR